MNTNYLKTMKIASLMLALLAATPLIAATPQTPPYINVYPARTFLELKVNEPYEGVFSITNQSPKTIKVRIIPEDWTALGEGKRELNAQSWLKFDKQEVLIRPLKKIQLTYKIILPQKTEGEKIAQVFFEPTYKSDEGGTLRTRSGVLLTALAKGTEKLKLGNLSTKISYSEKSKDPQLTLKLENLGNVYLKWQVDVQVMDSKNNIISKNRFESIQSLLKGEIREYVSTLGTPLPKHPKNLIAKISLQYGMQTLAEVKETIVIPVEVIGHE